VVFAELGDRITVSPAARSSLVIDGPFAGDLAADADNLVLQAAALMGVTAAIRLEKNLPVASGIGGGSADAAATLRALSTMADAPLPERADLLKLGADVPVCLHGQPVRMRGIGEELDPLPALPPLWVVLVNPRVSCPTPRIFAALEDRNQPGLGDLPKGLVTAADVTSFLKTTRNDLQAPAILQLPQIARAISALGQTQGCMLARMSGSGATVIGLYQHQDVALSAADALRTTHPRWWIAAAPLARPLAEG